MRTLLTALAAYSGCAAARRYLDRPGRHERDYMGGRVRRKPLWNEGAAFSLPIPAEALPLASAAALGLLWGRRKRCPLGTGLMLGGGLSSVRMLIPPFAFPPVPWRPARQRRQRRRPRQAGSVPEPSGKFGCWACG